MNKNPPPWSEADRQAVRTYYPLGGSPEVLKHLSIPRSNRSIQEQAALLNLSAPGRWTDELDNIIRARYTTEGAEVVAEQTGRTTLAVRRRAAILGVKADLHLSGLRRYQKHPKKPNPPKVKPKRARKANNPGLTVMAKRDRAPQVRLEGEPKITSDTKVTIAPPFVDRRFAPSGPVPRVVDSGRCRAWARAI